MFYQFKTQSISRVSSSNELNKKYLESHYLILIGRWCQKEVLSQHAIHTRTAAAPRHFKAPLIKSFIINFVSWPYISPTVR